MLGAGLRRRRRGCRGRDRRPSARVPPPPHAASASAPHGEQELREPHRAAGYAWAMAMEPLLDGHGRRIGDVRVSVTDRCNFRCQYCMPAEGLPWLERDEVLQLRGDRAARRRCWPRWASTDVRLTGGEPLVRRDFPRLVGDAGGLADVEDLSVTTNGYLLERDAEALVRAGVDRFNVSIDSLQRDRFFEMTRRDALPQVLRGLEALARVPRGAPDQGQRRRDARLHRGRGAALRALRPRAPLRGALHRVHAARRRPRVDARQRAHRRRDPRDRSSSSWPLEPAPREPHATARVYRFADGSGAIGFINPVSEPFCGDCNRIRLTADGRLRTCLFSLNETDLRDAAARGRRRRRARADRPRRGLAQGAQAPRQRAGLRPAGAHDVAPSAAEAPPPRASAPASSAAACRMSSGAVDGEERLLVGPLEDPRVERRRRRRRSGRDEVARPRARVSARGS